MSVDKENATSVSGSNKRGALKNVGLKRGKLQQTAPRKALSDVINEPANVAASRGHAGKLSSLDKNEITKSLTLSHKSLSEAENFSINTDNKKQNSKKTSLKGLKVLKDAESHTPNSKPTVTQKILKAPQMYRTEPEIDYEDYASDSILPKSERLSSYVTKLLTWRPPCLFGALPESESDNSDLEDLAIDDILLDVPVLSPTVPEFSITDLVNLMNDFPLPKPENNDHHRESTCQEKDLELSLDTTIDTSLSFGSLHVMHGSLDASQLSETYSSPGRDTSAQ